MAHNQPNTFMRQYHCRFGSLTPNSNSQFAIAAFRTAGLPRETKGLRPPPFSWLLLLSPYVTRSVIPTAVEGFQI